MLRERHRAVELLPASVHAEVYGALVIVHFEKAVDKTVGYAALLHEYALGGVRGDIRACVVIDKPCRHTQNGHYEHISQGNLYRYTYSYHQVYASLFTAAKITI